MALATILAQVDNAQVPAALLAYERLRRERVAELDHGQALVRFSAGAPDAVLKPEAQDQLSVFVQLASRLASRPPAELPGSELVLQVVGPHSADLWRFALGEEETLNLAGGEVRARKLSRVVQGKDELRVDVWLAPALNWLPARIRLTQASGDYIDQQWRSSEAP